MIGKRISVSSGEVLVITPDEWKKAKAGFESNANWMPYDSRLIEIHIANCGFGIIDWEYMTAIDDEYILEEVYNELKSHENV